MHSARNEYLQRAESLGLPPLIYLHHHVIDRVFSDFSDGFSSEDLLQEMLRDPVLTQDEFLRDRLPLVKAIVANTLYVLVMSGMLRESLVNEATYHFNWSVA